MKRACRSITGTTARDHLYGLGGATFEASGGGPSATFATLTRGTLGTRVSRFELYYLAQPKGGQLEKLDAQVLNRIRRIAGHEVRIVAPKLPVPAPVGFERFQVMKVQTPILIDERRGIP